MYTCSVFSSEPFEEFLGVKLMNATRDVLRPLISVVVPCYNEEQALCAFHQRLVDAVRQTEVQNALGYRTTTVYDGDGRVLATVDPLNRRTNYSYDMAGQVRTTQDVLGNVATFGYDAL